MLLHEIMGLFIKPAVLEENDRDHKLAFLDVTKCESQLAAKKINVGNGTKEALASSDVSMLQKHTFHEECLQMLSALVAKIQERCPLKHSFVRALKALDPIVMNLDPISVKTSFSNVTRKLVSTKIRTAAQCDLAERQYSQMLRCKKEELNQFNQKTQRLDQFYYNLLKGKEEFQELWQIVERILVLSHGQAKVERGFSVNEDMLLPNMKKETLVGMRLVYDTMKSQDVKIHEFNITDKMVQSCSQARAKYDIYLVDQTKAKAQQAAKRKASENEASYLKEKKKLKLLEEEAESCMKESDKKATKALAKHDFKLLAQSEALKDKARLMKTTSVAAQMKIVKDLQSKL